METGASVFAGIFGLSVLQVVWVNILLSGDNAVVIALACRGLPRRERLWGMIIGAGFASLLLIVFTGVVSMLMTLPYLRLAGALALLWIAVRLLAPQGHDAEDTPKATADLWRAVRIVVLADIVMSLDNVIAVAGVANGRYALLILGADGQHPDGDSRQRGHPGFARAFPRAGVGWRGDSRLGGRRHFRQRPDRARHVQQFCAGPRRAWQGAATGA